MIADTMTVATTSVITIATEISSLQLLQFWKTGRRQALPGFFLWEIQAVRRLCLRYSRIDGELIRMKVIAILSLSLFGMCLSSCVTERTPTNDRLSEESIGAATVGKKPGTKDRAHDYMMRRL